MGSGFSTSLLDKALEVKRQEREGLRLRLIEKAFTVLDRLAKDIPFDEAYLFGSIIKPYRFFKGTDIDIGFVGLKDKYFFKALAFVSGEMGMDVDIIQLEGHRLEDKVKKEGMKWTRKD
jgi:hypothetical protein